MSLNSFRTLNRGLQRIRLLYEVTTHSYTLLYEEGKQQLKSSQNPKEGIELRLQGKTVTRPLKTLAYHARDVYPQLLRSTLLIRLVAVYEAFLIDAIEELAERSDQPFESDKQVDMSQRELLTLTRRHGVKNHIVARTTRNLTNGGLEAIRKFYVSSLGFDILAQGQALPELEELHERRHIYVHRAGYVDEQYCHRFPSSGATPGKLLPVDEPYLLSAIDAVYASGSHIRNAAEAKFPMPQGWEYVYGDRHLVGDATLLVMASAHAVTQGAVGKLTDLTTPLSSGLPMGSVLVWAATDGRHLRWLIAGSASELKIVLKYLHFEEKSGEIVDLQSWKLNRERKEPVAPLAPPADLESISVYESDQASDESP